MSDAVSYLLIGFAFGLMAGTYLFGGLLDNGWACEERLCAMLETLIQERNDAFTPIPESTDVKG